MDKLLRDRFDDISKRIIKVKGGIGRQYMKLDKYYILFFVKMWYNIWCKNSNQQLYRRT